MRLKHEDELRQKEEKRKLQEAEMHRIKAAEQEKYENQRREELQLRLKKQQERRKMVREIQLQKSEQNFKMAVLGGVALFGIVKHLLTSNSETSKNPIIADKEVNISKPDAKSKI